MSITSASNIKLHYDGFVPYVYNLPKQARTVLASELCSIYEYDDLLPLIKSFKEKTASVVTLQETCKYDLVANFVNGIMSSLAKKTQATIYGLLEERKRDELRHSLKKLSPENPNKIRFYDHCIGTYINNYLLPDYASAKELFADMPESTKKTEWHLVMTPTAESFADLVKEFETSIKQNISYPRVLNSFLYKLIVLTDTSLIENLQKEGKDCATSTLVSDEVLSAQKKNPVNTYEQLVLANIPLALKLKSRLSTQQSINECIEKKDFEGALELARTLPKIPKVSGVAYSSLYEATMATHPKIAMQALEEMPHCDLKETIFLNIKVALKNEPSIKTSVDTSTTYAPLLLEKTKAIVNESEVSAHQRLRESLQKKDFESALAQASALPIGSVVTEVAYAEIFISTKLTHPDVALRAFNAMPYCDLKATLSLDVDLGALIEDY